MGQSADRYLGHIQAVQDLSRSRLSRLCHSGTSVGPGQEYLFAQDQLIGVRFVMGKYRTEWMIGASNIRVFCGDTELEAIPLTDIGRRAA